MSLRKMYGDMERKLYKNEKGPFRSLLTPILTDCPPAPIDALRILYHIYKKNQGDKIDES